MSNTEKLKRLSFLNDGGIRSYGFVAAVHIAMRAAGGYFSASVPEIPGNGFRFSRVGLLIGEQTELINYGISTAATI